jgi:hypothetical protein
MGNVMTIERTRLRFILGLGAAALAVGATPRARAAAGREITVYKSPT